MATVDPPPRRRRLPQPTATSGQRCLGETSALFAGSLAAADRVVATPELLAALGYSPKIAAAICRRYPEIATRIAGDHAEKRKLPEKDASGLYNYFAGRNAWEPVTMFRGINEMKLDPTWEGDSGRRIYVAQDWKDALSYADNDMASSLRHGKTHGLLVELQVPRFVLFGRADAGDYPSLKCELTPDFLPFLTRLGVVAYSQKAAAFCERGEFAAVAKAERIKWQTDAKVSSFMTPT